MMGLAAFLTVSGCMLASGGRKVGIFFAVVGIALAFIA